MHFEYPAFRTLIMTHKEVIIAHFWPFAKNEMARWSNRSELIPFHGE